MEKFTKWSDPATGINPFVPGVANKSISIVRLPLMLLSLGIWVWGWILYAVVFPLRRWIVWLQCRLVLRVLFVERLCDSKMDHRVKQNGSFDKVSSSTVIVCNHISVLEVMYFYVKFGSNVRFGFPVTDPLQETSRVAIKSFDEAYNHVTNPEARIMYSKALEFSDALGKVNRTGPLVLFIEGCTTNSRGLLKFHHNLFKKCPNVQFALVGIHGVNVSNTLTLQSQKHFRYLMSHLYNELEIHWDDRFYKCNSHEEFPAIILKLIRNCKDGKRTQMLQLTSRDKVSFTKYWVKTS